MPSIYTPYRQRQLSKNYGHTTTTTTQTTTTTANNGGHQSDIEIVSARFPTAKGRFEFTERMAFSAPGSVAPTVTQQQQQQQQSSPSFANTISNNSGPDGEIVLPACCPTTTAGSQRLRAGSSHTTSSSTAQQQGAALEGDAVGAGVLVLGALGGELRMPPAGV